VRDGVDRKMAAETCGMDRQIVNADRIATPIGAVETPSSH
jgi:hypothetical protein